MTLQEVLTKADDLKPNQYEEGNKLDWINTVENRVYQTMKRRKGSEEIEKPKIDTNSDCNEELLLPDAYCDIYIYYIHAMIDYFNGETTRYNNSVIMYDNAWSEFENYWYREHPQVSDGIIKRR